MFEVWSVRIDSDELIQLFHSKRFEQGPTAEQILSGDHSAFAYGVGAAVGPTTRPLLWDRHLAPDSNRRLVAFATGMVKQVSEEDFAKLDLGVPAQ